MTTNQSLPNSTAVLVLGILSILCSCFFVGLLLGIIGIVMAGKGRKLNKENPGVYGGAGALNAGYVMSIIGTVLGGLTLLYYLFVGASILSILSMT